MVQIKSYGAAFHGRRKSYGLLSIESFSGFFGENGVDAFLGTLPIFDHYMDVLLFHALHWRKCKHPFSDYNRSSLVPNF